MAHAVFENFLKENSDEGWEVDSAAIGSWHIGNQPDRRALRILSEKGITFSHTVRQIQGRDFTHYDWIFGMDNENIRALNSMAPEGSTAKIELLGSYDTNNILIIRDPYYDDDDQGFYDCFDQCYRSVKAFLSANSTAK
jgi:low molecular weight phosphotyrosine protein phosphatase